MSLGINDFNIYMKPDRYQEELDRYFPTGKQSYTVGGETKYFNVERWREEGNKWLTQVTELDKQGGEAVGYKDPLRFRAGIGPSIRETGRPVVTIESSTGGNHPGFIGLGIFQKTEKPTYTKGEIKFWDNPVETAKAYSLATFFVPKEDAKETQGKFWHVLSQGMEEAMLPGGMMSVARGSHSDSAIVSMGQRVVHGFARDIVDQAAALEYVGRQIHAGDAPLGSLVERIDPRTGNTVRNPVTNEPEMIGAAALLAGKVPFAFDDGRTRWREASQTRPEEINDQYYWNMFGGTDQGGKLNVNRSERERTIHMRRNEQGYLETAYPQPITERGQQGLRLLNVQFGGGRADGVMVTDNTYMVPATPDSGADIIYNDAPENEGLIGGAWFQTRQTRNIYPRDYLSLKKETTFEWGIFDKTPVKNEEGKFVLDTKGNKTYKYNRRLDKEGNEMPLVGYTLGEGQSEIIGLQKTTNRDTLETIITEHKLYSDTRITTVTGLPTMVIPGYHNPDTGEFTAAPGVDPRKATEGITSKSFPISDDDKMEFVDMMGGGAVEFGQITGYNISIPIAEANATGTKQQGKKAAERFARFATPEGSRQRTVDTLAGPVNVNRITSSIKNPLSQFAAGTLGTMIEPELNKLIGDLYPGKELTGMRKEMRGIVKPVFARQRELQAQLARGEISEERYAESHPYVSGEDLANVYAKHVQGAENMQSWQFADDMLMRFNALARNKPTHVKNEYGYALVDKPQYFDYLEIDKGWKPYLQTVLNTSVDLAAKQNPAHFSKELAESIKANHYDFQETSNPDRLMWRIKQAGRWGTNASSTVTEHLSTGLPGLGLEGMAALQSEFSEAAAATLGMQKYLQTPGEKGWKTLDQWYTLEGANQDLKGTSLPAGLKDINYTSVSKEQADDINARLAMLPPNESGFNTGWDQVFTDVLGPDTKDILQMDFGSKKSIPRPSVVGATAEFNYDEYGIQIPVSGTSYHYPGALTDILKGFDYSSGPAQNFFNNIENIFQTSGESLKGLQRNRVPGLAGKRGSIGGTLPPGYSVISKQQMLGALTAEAKGLNYPVFNEAGRINEEYLNKAYEEVKKQGYHWGLKSTDPAYSRGNYHLLSKVTTPEIVRENLGVDIPDNYVTENGKVISGARDVWGLAGLSQFEGSAQGSDEDLDQERTIFNVDENPLYAALDWQQKLLYDYRREQEGQNLLQLPSGIKEKFEGNFLGLMEERFGKMTDQKLGGPFNAMINEMTGAVETLYTPGGIRKFQEKTGLARVSQSGAVSGAIDDSKVKGEVGRAYNVRRLMDSTIQSMARSGKWTPEQINELYDVNSESYMYSLEGGKGGPQEREFETIVSSITPYQEDNGTYGYGYRARRLGQDEAKYHALGNDFDSQENLILQSSAVTTDVKNKLLTKRQAVFGFATSGEMLEEFRGRLNNGESMSSILDSLKGRKGYHFSESEWGKIQQAALEDKVKGITTTPYRLKSGRNKGLSAENILGNKPFIIGGEEYPLSQMPEETQVAAILQQYQKRKQSHIPFEQRARIEKYALGMEQQGIVVPPIVQSMRNQLNTSLSYHVSNMTETIGQMISPDPISIDNLRISPSMLPSLAGDIPYADKRRRDFVAEQIFGIKDLTGYIPEERKQRDKFTQPGKDFEAARSEELVGKMGLEDAVFNLQGYADPEQTRLGYMGGQIDVGGIDPTTGKLIIGDIKWSATKETAEAKATDRSLVGPQLIGYYDRLKTAASRGLEHFQKAVLKEWRIGNRSGKEKLDAAKEKASKWYDAIQGPGMEIGVAAAYPRQKVGADGREMFDKNQQPVMEDVWLNEDQPFTSFGTPTDEEIEQTRENVQGTINDIFSPQYRKGVAAGIDALPQSIKDTMPAAAMERVRNELGPRPSKVSPQSIAAVKEDIASKYEIKAQPSGGGDGDGGNNGGIPAAPASPIDPNDPRKHRGRKHQRAPQGSIGTTSSDPRFNSLQEAITAYEGIANVPYQLFDKLATVKERRQYDEELFAGANVSGGFFGKKGDATTENMYYGTYIEGVAALREYEGAIEDKLDKLPALTVTNLSGALKDMGIDHGFTITPDGWVDAQGNPQDLEQNVIPSMRALLKKESRQNYAVAMKEPKLLADEAMVLQDKMQKGAKAAGSGKIVSKELEAGTVIDMDTASRSGTFSLAKAIHDDKDLKGIISPRGDGSIQKATIEAFEDSYKALKELPDTIKELKEKFEALTKTATNLTEAENERFKSIGVDIAGFAGKASVARATAVQSAELLQDKDALSYKDQASIAKAGSSAISTYRANEKKLRSKIDELTGEEEEGEGGGKMGAFSRSLRGLFGGWGLMYAGRLAQMGLGVWEKQYSAGEQFEMSSMQAARRMYGSGFGEGVAPLSYAQQTARIRGGGGIYGDVARAGTWVDDYSDITSPLMGGVGAALGAHWALPTMFPALGSTGALAGALGPIALGLAAATAGTLYVANQARNIQNYDETIAMAAAQSASGRPGAAWWKMSGIRVADRVEQMAKPENEGIRSSYAATQFMIGSLGGGMVSPFQGIGEPGSGTQRERKYTTLIEKIVDGDMTVGELKALEKEMGKEEFFWFTQAFGGTDAAPFNQLQAATRVNAIYGALSAENSSAQIGDLILSSGLDIEAGGTGMQLAAGIHGMIGQFSTEGVLAETSQMITALPSIQQQKVASTLSLLERTPGARREFYSMDRDKFLEIAAGVNRNLGSQFGGKAPLSETAGLYADIAGGQWEEYFLKAKGLQETLRQSGVTWALDENKFRKQEEWTSKDEAEFKDTLTLKAAQASTIEGFAQMGMGYEAAGQMVTALEDSGLVGTQFLSRLQSFEPRAWGQTYQQYISSGMTREASLVSPIAALANYDMVTGQPTNQSMFKTSMVNPLGGLQDLTNKFGRQQNAMSNAEQIWGTGWQGSQAANAAVFGINKETGEIYTSFQPDNENIRQGEQSWGWQNLYQNYAASKASLGSSYAQIALQEEYMPKFWDVQDRQRALAHRQQLWQFDQQDWQLDFSQRRMELGEQQWQESRGLQQKQAQMQRGWTMEDWGYQDLTRSLQWGWQQEDFAENVRFMTGRQRKLSERQMERQTTMFNLETGQIDTQRDRQKEMWALQDERFDMEARHHQEQLEMQQESLEKQREQFDMQKQFYEERRKLEEESIALSREYQMKQLELQKAALGVQAQQIENQFDMGKKQLEINETQNTAMDNAKTLQQESVLFFESLVENLPKVNEAFNEMIDNFILKMKDPSKNPVLQPPTFGNEGGGTGLDVSVPIEQAGGGDQFVGSQYVVGEAGLELVRPRTIGSVVNQYDVAQIMSQEDRWASRSVFYPTQRGEMGGGGGGPSILNVYVGNEKLASFVLNTVKKDLEVL